MLSWSEIGPPPYVVNVCASQACVLDQRLDMIDVSMELWWVLVVMLGWRALYTSH